MSQDKSKAEAEVHKETREATPPPFSPRRFVLNSDDEEPMANPSSSGQAPVQRSQSAGKVDPWSLVKTASDTTDKEGAGGLRLRFTKG